MINQDSLIKYLDLRGTPCPLNFIRCSLAIENLNPNESLKVQIERGEPEESVILSLRNAGHEFQILKQNEDNITLIISPCDI